jgi:hypothetical protein
LPNHPKKSFKKIIKKITNCLGDLAIMWVLTCRKGHVSCS